MRIALDARALSHSQNGGFKTYTLELIRHLTRVDMENEYLLYLDRPLDENILSETKNVTRKIIPARMPLLGAGLREQFELPHQLARDRVNVAHFPMNTAPRRVGVPFAVTLHDTISLDEHPPLREFAPTETVKRWSMFLYNRELSFAAARHAHIVITVSENSKRDLVHRFGLNPARIRVIYEAPAEVFRPLADARVGDRLRAKFSLEPNFILALSSASPRKNARGLVEAYARLSPELRRAHQLVIVWTHGLWKEQISKQVQQLGVQARVVFLEQVTDEDLVGLYNAASLYVFPSLYEGFGLPPLEAMACGTPVVASNLSSIPEVLGDAALLVNPYNAGELSRALESVLTRPDLARALSEKGRAWARRYSWERCARETLEVYRQIASAPR